jgi:uncharacterized protein (DUF1501 family)
MNRREFLRYALLATGSALMSIGTRGWAARVADTLSINRRLIVVFMRGAVDGLNAVVPYGDDHYYQARPNIAIPKSGQDDGVLDLDGYFGLHPALAPVLPLWQNHSLAFVHASGSPDPNRSHFEAQAYMETGTPGDGSVSSGWMNRLLGVMPGTRTPTEALSLGNASPLILTGPYPVSNLPLGRNAGHAMPMDRPLVSGAYASLYKGDSPIDQAFHQGQEARGELMGAMQQEMAEAANGAPDVSGFSSDTRRLANLMRRDASIRLAFLSVGGWDTHVGEGASKGQLANHLQSLASGLATLARGLGDLYQDSIILVMSEFGRTVHENGNAGTDHGHGNVMWVMGGPVKGGKVYGEWPGLADAQLYENRDLAVTTDFRQVIGTLLSRHLRLTDSNLGKVFPDGLGATANLHDLLST